MSHRIVIAIASLSLGAALALAQSGAGSINGTVVDSTGASVPDARITAAFRAGGITRTTTSSTEGAFSILQVPPGDYTVTVEKAGFDTIEKTGVILTTGERVSAGQFTLSPKGLTHIVTVSADAGQLQLRTESGERSDLITGVQVRDLALNGRNLLDMMKILPGVVSTVNGQVSNSSGLSGLHINGTRGSQNELTIDGSSNVITGTNNNQHISINPDAVAEVRVLTSNFQAEHAKASGSFIQYTTRSGSNEFHGGGRYFRRHDSLNANGFFNNAQGLPRGLYRYDYYGYDIGGPVIIPGTNFNKNRDRLFFFWNQEFYDQLTPISAKSIRVPTELERNGDFSETTNGQGARVFISDPLAVGANGARLPCTAANTLANPGGCFVSGGRLHVIPRARIFKDGESLLGVFPLPNDPAGGLRYNYTSQISGKFPRREDILRIDSNISSDVRVFARGAFNPDSHGLPYGINQRNNFPLTYVEQKRQPLNLAASLVYILSPTTTNEFLFGPSWYYYIFRPMDNKGTRGAYNITYPQLFPSADVNDFLPNLSFSGIPNQTFPAITNTGLARRQANETLNLADNFTKILGKHTVKAGIFLQRSTFVPANPQPVNSQVTYSNDANNPFNTGHPFSNALLGIYTTYSQASNHPYPKLRFHNTEWYVQDTWKAHRRLTLDYGLRFYMVEPEYNIRGSSSVFNAGLFDPAKAVRLYAPVLVGGQRRAVDPAGRPPSLTPSNTLPAIYIGRIVPGSGDMSNGMGQTASGYPRGCFENPGVLYAPRFGFAWDIAGDARTVVRGGFGITYQRVATTIAIAQVNQPPLVVQPQLFYGYLSDLGAGAGTLAPSGVQGMPRQQNIPRVYSHSIGVQRNLGFGAILDVAYVSTLGRHLWQNRDLNGVPYGATFTKAGQDPSRYPGGVVPDAEANLPVTYRQAGLTFSGANALTAEFLRPYQGYGSINYREFSGSSNYHSLQVSLNRRFSRGLTFGLAYTWSKVFGTADEDNEGGHPFDTRRYDYRLMSYDRTHVFAANYVYGIPKLGRFLGSSAVARAVFDNWQLSGICQYSSGTPLELSMTIAGINTGQRILGSYSVSPSFYLKGDPGKGAGELLLDPDAFLIPPINDIGPYPRTYLRNPGWFNNDISIFKNIGFGSERRFLQLRLEMFNAFNSTQFTDINVGTQLTSSTGGTGAAVFNEFPNLKITNNLRTPQSTQRYGLHFGEYNADRGARVIQLGAKIYF